MIAFPLFTFYISLGKPQDHGECPWVFDCKSSLQAIIFTQWLKNDVLDRNNLYGDLWCGKEGHSSHCMLGSFNIAL